MGWPAAFTAVGTVWAVVVMMYILQFSGSCH